MKKCVKCSLLKELIEFVSRKNAAKYVSLCQTCRDKKKTRDKKYYENNKDYLNQQKSVLYQKNKDEILNSRKSYYLKNKEIIKKSVAGYQKLRRQADPSFKLRQNISVVIGHSLKINRGDKHGKSILGFLNYTIDELREHLENQFEPWMTWDNYGKYEGAEWQDNDPTTWKWNIDHIIPQSSLPYGSMEEENFQKCWALENLRPLSAKQNIIKGAR